MKLKILQEIVDVIRGKKGFLRVPMQKLFFLKQKKILKHLKKTSKEQKIKVAFLVIYDSVFPAKPLFEEMLNDDFFEPFIVVIPDTARGKENMLSHIKKAMISLTNKYSSKYVISGYNDETEEFIDISNKCNLFCSANPYSKLTHKFFRAEYLTDKKVLSFFVNYFYMGRTKYELSIPKLKSYSLNWRVFAENEVSQDLILKNTMLKKENVPISGYIKMDSLIKVNKQERSRKKIIISPHHTVRKWENGLNLSNFLDYADLFLSLPSMYKNIDFVFRPHPLLINNLRAENVWGEEKTSSYFNKMMSFENVIYQDGGDYFDTFVNSDGLIHDCGSFLAEYFYTGNPQCYLLKSKEETEKEFLPFGMEMLSHTYTAFNEKEIIEFIEDVVISDNDVKKLEREEFFRSKIAVNYPKSTEIVLQNIKSAIRKAK